uniref:Tetraspanin n=1 Tax=Setaria digitata TaxID=48799 RepID=A0A915PQW8_9BILA
MNGSSNDNLVLNLCVPELQLTGLALIFLSLWALLDPRRNYLLDLVDFSEDDPLLRQAIYLALFTGSVTLIVGFIGCCGTIKKSLYLLISFVGDKLSVYLTKLTYDRYYRLYWVTPLIDIIQYYFLTTDFDQKLKWLIRENYGVGTGVDHSAKVTVLVDRLQFNEQCCGSVNYKEWNASRWRTSSRTDADLFLQQPQSGFDALPITCCVQLNGATPMNPVARSLARCQQSQANKFWRHQTQQCCGATGPYDYYDSFWYKTNTQRGTISFVPQSCCKQLQEARAWFIKPIDPMCTTYNYYTSAFNSSVNVQGCHEKLLNWLTIQTIIFVAVGLSFAAFQVPLVLDISNNEVALVHSDSRSLQVDPDHFVHHFHQLIRLTEHSGVSQNQIFERMVKKKNKHRKKVNNRGCSAKQKLPKEKGYQAKEVTRNTSVRVRSDMEPVSNPILLWSNSKAENISRTPGGIRDECPEYAKLTEHRRLAAKYHDKGDQKFLAKDFRGAYDDFLRAMKILGEHGSITDGFGRDGKMLRVYQDKCCICFWVLYRTERNLSHFRKCFECYNKLIEKDLSHAFWYKRRAILLRDECHAYKSAYEDFVLFTALMREYRLTVTKEEVDDTIYCFYQTANMAWSLEKEKLNIKKPFLTSDWINLWALCPCDDVLLEDLLSVRAEDKDPQNKSTLSESAYKDALKQTVRGYHSLVVDTLLGVYISGQGLHRAESLLLLALIYSQIDSNEVYNYLDTFIAFWEVDQFRVPIRRRKQILMRYMSIARALLISPLKDINLSMFSSKEQAQFYIQTALTVILRLQLLEGTVESRIERNLLNMAKLENIENLCDRAIKADKQSLYAGMLREYTVVEIALIDDTNNHSSYALNVLEEYIEVIQDQFRPEHQLFSLWCLFSAYFINGFTDEAIAYGMELEKDLLFPGFIASFLVENECPLTENIDTECVLNCINQIEKRLDHDPENFRLYLNIAEFHYHLISDAIPGTGSPLHLFTSGSSVLIVHIDLPSFFLNGPIMLLVTAAHNFIKRFVGA